MNELIARIATEMGPIGLVLAAAYMYIRLQHKELREVEAKRVDDNKAMVTKLLELNDKWMETINAQMEVGEEQKNALMDLKKLLFDEKMRRRG
jgi:hypothetical protein